MAKGGKSLPLDSLRQRAAAKSAGVASMRRAPSSFSLDLSTVPDPPRTYYAQECWAEIDRGIIGIFFAQKSRSGGPLRSLVCMRMTPMYVINWLKAVDDIHSPSIAEIASICGITAEQLNPIADEAEQTFEASASVVKTGMSAFEVSLDFIKIWPFEISNAKSGSKFAKGDPQVRIDLRSSLFLGLMDNLRELTETFPSEFKFGEDE
jgi:hypothetical protein